MMNEAKEVLNIFADQIDDIYLSPNTASEHECDMAIARFCDQYGFDRRIKDACEDWLYDMRHYKK